MKMSSLQLIDENNFKQIWRAGFYTNYSLGNNEP